MAQPCIAVDIGDLRLATKPALRKAADLAFRVVELPTTQGDLAPRNLSASGRRHLSSLVGGLGLKVVALRGDMRGIRLTDPRTVDEHVFRTCEVLDLAKDLGVNIVTASAGALTHPETGDPSPQALDALRRIGEFADGRGLLYAIRPVCDSGDRIARVLDELGCPSIGICLDPAEMVMGGANPLSRIERYVEQIQLMHARDATSGSTDRTGYETPMGEGDVDLRGLMAVLDAAEYRGAYVVRRTESLDPSADLNAARDVLAGMLPPG